MALKSYSKVRGQLGNWVGVYKVNSYTLQQLMMSNDITEIIKITDDLNYHNTKA